MIFIYIFIIILLFNLLPVFTPPTWMLLSYIGVKYQPDLIILSLVGAVAATCGRLLLAQLSTVLVRNHWLAEHTIKNIDVIRDELKGRKKLTATIFLLYAFGPLPSNQLFIAYGLSNLKLSVIAFPFFIGRLASYLFWAFTAKKLTEHVVANSLFNKEFFSGYFIFMQLLTLLMIYIFTKIDWHRLIKERKLGWVKKDSKKD